MVDRDVGDPNALAARSRARGTTRDGSPVASSGVAALVAFALPPSGRPAADRRRVEGPHPAYVAREPAVGREPDCRRACEARVARLAAHGRQVPPEGPGAWPRAGLEDVFPEPRLAGLGLRLLYGGHRAFPNSLRVRRHLPRAPRVRPRRCHRAPDGRVGRSAHDRGRRRHPATLSAARPR